MRMSVDEAKIKLTDMKTEHAELKDSLNRFDREYACYLSVQIKEYEDAIRNFTPRKGH